MIERRYTVTDVAEKLNLNPETVRRWVRSGILPMIKPGCAKNSKMLISPAKFEKFMDNYHYDLVI